MVNPQLETFIRVADAGSFSRAAEQSFITPTAVIKQINLLEDELGLTLFNRTHRGLTLTRAGASLYQDAKYIIAYCRDSVTRAKSAMLEAENVIRIGTSPMTPAQILVSLWPRLHALCPDIKFQLVPFENTPENAREILRNLGKNIDVVAGIFDDKLLSLRSCAGFELSREPICVAVSVHHPLASHEALEVTDLYGESLLLMRRGWSAYVDALRDDLRENHSAVNIIDFDFYDLNAFNRCQNSNDMLMAVGIWRDVHPLLKVLPVHWAHEIPYGLLHAPEPSETVRRFLDAVRTVQSPNPVV